jgi:hypothetical protein
MTVCCHNHIVRLELPGGDSHWICNWCNAEFVLKAAVDYKLAHLTNELGKRMIDESAAGVWREEGL